jgi:hypothetical protein
MTKEGGGSAETGTGIGPEDGQEKFYSKPP